MVESAPCQHPILSLDQHDNLAVPSGFIPSGVCEAHFRVLLGEGMAYVDESTSTHANVRLYTSSLCSAVWTQAG